MERLRREPMIAWKFHPPRSPRDAVRRPHLVERLRSASRVSLIAAPAGWGKSTLVAEWLATPSERTVAFASLDQLDNEPRTFWGTLIGALASGDVDAGVRVPVSPQAGGSPIWPAVVPPIIERLARFQGPVSIVLDDYQLISDPRIHEGVRYLIDHLPDGHHVSIASRSEPPLRIARLRASGLLTEIRSEDLAFDDVAVGAVVRCVAEIDLQGPIVTRLQRRTEGWPAAVHLAALSLRSAESPDAFVEEFVGTQRHVADYLSAEVLDGIAPQMSAFLCRCSILDDLNVELCRRVSRDDEAARLLAEAETTGLFTTPLGEDRSWFRIHRLFRDWLQHRLAVDMPGEVAALHRRACEWYVANGMLEEAITHALDGGDWALARALIREVAPGAADEGRGVLLTRWLARLPPDEVASDPVLAVAGASTAATAGDLDRARRLIEIAKQAASDCRSADSEISVEVEILVAECLVELMGRNLVAATSLGQRASAWEVDPGRHRYGIAHVMWATALFWSGRPDEARDVIDRVLDDIRTPFVQLLAGGVLAASCLESGQVERAERVAREATATARERRSGPAPELAMSYLALGGALIDLGDPREASAALQLGIDLSEAWNAAPQAAYGRLLLARLHAVAGDVSRARRLLGDAVPIVESARVPGTLERTMRTARAELRGSGPRNPMGAPVQLTEREHDILRLLGSRLSQRAIGTSLGITRNTVKSYTQSLYRKLGVSSRKEAVDQGRRLRLI